ncbi:MAG: DNA replication/repair protein RecF [Clostridia bacterium]|nr:DNA replication/repair protein RecF [Clostridia bacterium]
MYFKSAELTNFRNYKSLSIDFDRHLNLFLGKNAQGKTNLLESLFIMSLGKSFRTLNDSEMISFGCDYAKAVSHVVNDDEDDETKIEIIYGKEGKTLKVDDVKLTRSIDLLENVYVVIFFPDDLRIIKEGPENRRRFLDRELCQIKPVYYSNLANYKRVLKQRNTLLKQNNKDKGLYEVFDEALSDYGVRILEERQKFTDKINEISSEIHSKISNGNENLVISYETKLSFERSLSVEEKKEKYRKLLDRNFDNDIFRGHTGIGPHKDDLKIEVNGIDIRQYGSQGQQRTATLSMKLAEITLIKQETGCDAVLLLDDVLSELDRSRQRFLIESMKDVQLFISAAEIDDEVMKLLKATVYEVDNGTIKKLTKDF